MYYLLRFLVGFLVGFLLFFDVGVVLFLIFDSFGVKNFLLFLFNNFGLGVVLFVFIMRFVGFFFKGFWELFCMILLEDLLFLLDCDWVDVFGNLFIFWFLIFFVVGLKVMFFLGLGVWFLFLYWLGFEVKWGLLGCGLVEDV